MTTTPRLRSRRSVALLVGTGLLGAALGAGTSPDAVAQDSGEPPVHIAVGAPKEDIGRVRNAGATTLLLSDPLPATFIWRFDDLSPVPDNTIVYRQGANGISGSPEAGDQFGHAVVLGDFNGDRTPDIAISAPGEDSRRKRDVGVVHVVHGRDGVAHGGTRVTLHPGRRGVPGRRVAGDRFGEALAVADLNGDGYDELIVGTPRKDHSGATDAGEIHVFFGSENGLTTRSERIRQGSNGIPDQPEDGDRFGQVLASHTGALTLAVGIPREDVDGVRNAGAVQIIAPTNAPAQEFFHQGQEAFDEQLERGDQFGHAVSIDSVVGHSGFALSVGVPREDFNGRVNAGLVHVVSHPPEFFTGTLFSVQTIDLTTRGYQGDPESGDRFGWSLTQAGQRPIVGVPGDDPGGIDGTGSIRYTFGQMMHQNSAGVPDRNEPGDAFGLVGAASPYRPLLVFGVPQEDIGATRNAGMVLFQSRGINGPGWLRVDEASELVPGTAERFDRFGDAVAVW